MSVQKLTRDDLYSLEKYAEIRNQFRAQVIAHKKGRIVALGAHATLHFEDRLTMHYQVQEMLRAERVFEAEGIQDELDAYNPLIPDGSNWKATFMLEYDDPNERRLVLPKLIGIEDHVWVQAAGCERVYAVADEDMDRENEDKTSSVHFLRFELTAPMVVVLKQGGAISAGIAHEHYSAEATVTDKVRASLVADLV